MSKDKAPDKNPYAHLPYRPGVGIVLFNREGKIFVGKRLDNPADAWQMPQGGIDEGEDPMTAVFREMEEEIGTRNAEILGAMEEWQHYDIPERLIQKLWNGRYRGQKQKWIALRFLGDDSEINLSAYEHPEFSAWRWAGVDELLDLAIHFKRGVYAKVIDEFRRFATNLSS